MLVDCIRSSFGRYGPETGVPAVVRRALGLGIEHDLDRLFGGVILVNGRPERLKVLAPALGNAPPGCFKGYNGTRFALLAGHAVLDLDEVLSVLDSGNQNA